MSDAVIGPSRQSQSSVARACARLERAVAALEDSVSDGWAAERDFHDEIAERLDTAVARLKSVLGE